MRSGSSRRTRIPAGNETRWKRDERGLILSYTDAAGRTTEYEHDPEGRVARIINPEGGIVAVVRDARGNPVRVTDPANKVTGYEYDARGLITTIGPTGARCGLGGIDTATSWRCVAPNGGVFRVHVRSLRAADIDHRADRRHDDKHRLRRPWRRGAGGERDGGRELVRLRRWGIPSGTSRPARTYKIGWAGLDQNISLTRPDGAEGVCCSITIRSSWACETRSTSFTASSTTRPGSSHERRRTTGESSPTTSTSPETSWGTITGPANGPSWCATRWGRLSDGSGPMGPRTSLNTMAAGRSSAPKMNARRSCWSGIRWGSWCGRRRSWTGWGTPSMCGTTRSAVERIAARRWGLRSASSAM